MALTISKEKLLGIQEKIKEKYPINKSICHETFIKMDFSNVYLSQTFRGNSELFVRKIISEFDDRCLCGQACCPICKGELPKT